MTVDAENIAGSRDKNLVKTGAIGTAIMAVCCFTPVLVISLGAVGLSTWLGWLDFVLIPGLLIFMCLLGFGLWRLQST